MKSKEVKEVFELRCKITPKEQAIVKKFINAWRKRYGLKKDGTKYNQPDAVKDIILLSENEIDLVIEKWENEVKEFEHEQQVLLNKRFATGA